MCIEDLRCVVVWLLLARWEAWRILIRGSMSDDGERKLREAIAAGPPKFPFPKVVIVEVEGDPRYVTDGLGLFPGVEWDDEVKSLVVHWHECHERLSLVDFLLEDSLERYQWKADESGVFTLRPMTVEDWKTTFVPRGWGDRNSLEEITKLVAAAL